MLLTLIYVWLVLQINSVDCKDPKWMTLWMDKISLTGFGCWERNAHQLLQKVFNIRRSITGFIRIDPKNFVYWVPALDTRKWT